jgi:hypothetical protein
MEADNTGAPQKYCKTVRIVKLSITRNYNLTQSFILIHYYVITDNFIAQNGMLQVKILSMIIFDDFEKC